jgi:hypothetical protein
MSVSEILVTVSGPVGSGKRMVSISPLDLVKRVTAVDEKLFGDGSLHDIFILRDIRSAAKAIKADDPKLILEAFYALAVWL